VSQQRAHDNNNDHVTMAKKVAQATTTPTRRATTATSIALSPIRQTGIKFDYQNFIISQLFTNIHWPARLAETM
jgi:hypothetical protein